jgi:hypothetical protein
MANIEKDKLIMKWDKDKIQSWVWDKLLFEIIPKIKSLSQSKENLIKEQSKII